VDASRIHLSYALQISRNGEGEREFVLRTNPASAFEFRRLSVRLSRFPRTRAGPHDWMRRGERSGAREKRSKNPRIPRARGADACGARRGVTHRGGFASITSHRIASHRVASHRITSRRVASRRVTSRKSMPVLYCVSLQRAYMTVAGSLHRYDDQTMRRAFIQ